MTEFTYPKQLEIHPYTGPPLSASVTVPGSKSITNRALVLAALSPHCRLTGALRSEDTLVMIECLRQLGWGVNEDWEREIVDVWQVEDDLTTNLARFQHADLFVGNSGTTIRFLIPMLALHPGEYRLDGIPRMRQRPIGDLLDALRQLAADVQSEADNGCPPVRVIGRTLRGGRTRIRLDKSSQYLSGLLLALPFAPGD